MAIIAAVLSPAVAASAQQPEEPRPGQRVRISFECPAASAATPSGTPAACDPDARLTGALIRLGDDSLALETGGSIRSYALSSITSLEASRGWTSRWKAGGLIGFVGGTALTFAVLDSGNPSSTNLCDPENNQDAIGGAGTCLLIAAGAGGLPAGFIGMLVGSRLRTERWSEVGLPRGVGLTVLPLGFGAYVGVSVAVR